MYSRLAYSCLSSLLSIHTISDTEWNISCLRGQLFFRNFHFPVFQVCRLLSWLLCWPARVCSSENCHRGHPQHLSAQQASSSILHDQLTPWFIPSVALTKPELELQIALKRPMSAVPPRHWPLTWGEEAVGARTDGRTRTVDTTGEKWVGNGGSRPRRTF